ncbi:HesA/MoeB/ThiF family protein [Agrilactobacillus yilanensis]|uniref:HesA/MoeB/ThiF family protein n=1 Tax=Agrilactobacillus yilanensis TaxID=2485997 RepID=A0ABW4J6A3_9LACO|nr:HesA/MoeB/ThiF family protein [Agrilactobacillus yilanensis]
MNTNTNLDSLARYDRQMRVKQIGQNGQTNIRQARVLLIGAGALGSYCAELLARAGVGALEIFDPDIVSLTNLQRQTLFTEADAASDTFKVEAVQKALAAINSEVAVTVHPYELSESRFQDLPAFDLAIDCTDNFQVRDLLNQLALKYNFDFIFGSCAGVSGNVMAVDPKNGPCLHCLFPNIEALKKTDCDLLGVNTALIPLVSGLQVSLALKYLTAKKEVAFNQLITIDNWRMTQQKFTVLKNPNCKACSQPTTQITEDYQNTMKVLCGTNVYSIYLDASLNLTTMKQFLTAQKITFTANPLCVQFVWQDLNLTYFKNHKLFIYDAPDKTSALTIYDTLTQRLQQTQEAKKHAQSSNSNS